MEGGRLCYSFTAKMAEHELTFWTDPANMLNCYLEREKTWGIR